MTNEEILKKAIEKAYKNGYESWRTKVYEDDKNEPADVDDLEFFEPIRSLYRDLLEDPERCGRHCFIFRHDFAKAFWGVEEKNVNDYGDDLWEYHLQQMVLEEDPIKYLEKFL